MNRLSSFVPAKLLQFSTLAFFVLLFGVFCAFEPGFRAPQNLLDILEQSVPVAVVGVGMTFVLLTAGIDLAVGATMYAAVVIAGLYLKEAPVFVMIGASVSVGATIGAAHAAIVHYCRVAPFIVTLATMFVLRGAGKRLTQTKAIIAEEAVTRLERASMIGVPLAVWVLVALVCLAWLVLKHTGIGRQVYAVGENREAAKKAGISVGRVTYVVYIICGSCAGLGGFLALTQQGAAQNTFGTGVEFAAVAAAVLGGNSLFGGRGNAWGAVFGAVFVGVVNASLNFSNADPYVYPLVTASLIFAATALDSARNRLTEQQSRRRIRN